MTHSYGPPDGGKLDSDPERPKVVHDDWLDVRDLATRYKCSTRHVIRLADKGAIPTGTKFGALRRWSRRAIEIWEATR